MAEEKNMEKYETYKKMHEDLKSAMKHEFYYQAIFIEYAILEDRLASVLKYAGISYVNRNGKDVTITMKISYIQSRRQLSAPFYKERLSDELMDNLRKWLQKRNELIHHLAKLPYDHENVKEIAEEGYQLVKIVQNKSASVINHLKKEV